MQISPDRIAPRNHAHLVLQHEARPARLADAAAADRRPRPACRRRSAPGRTSRCRGCAAARQSRLGSRSPITLDSRLMARAYIASALSRLKPAASCTPHDLGRRQRCTRCSSSATNGLGARFNSAISSRQLLARRTLRHLAAVARGGSPVVDARAGDRGDVVARLLRHRSGAGEPVPHPAGTGIVGGGREAEIAELIAQLAEEFGRLRQRLHGIEGIEQPALVRGARHELRDALRALAVAGDRADRIGLEAALLPDHAREEFERQVVRPRRRSRSSGTSPRGCRSRARHPQACRGRPRRASRQASPVCPPGLRQVSPPMVPVVRLFSRVVAGAARRGLAQVSRRACPQVAGCSRLAGVAGARQARPPRRRRASAPASQAGPMRRKDLFAWQSVPRWRGLTPQARGLAMD